jgi:hypothetical protein
MIVRFVALTVLLLCCPFAASAERLAEGVEAEVPPSWHAASGTRPRKLKLYGEPDHEWTVDVIAEHQAQAGCFVTVSRTRLEAPNMPVSLVEQGDWASFCEEKGCGLAPWSKDEESAGKRQSLVGDFQVSDDEWNRELLREIVRERDTSTHRLIDVTVIHATTRRATRGGAKGAGTSGVSVVVVLSCPERTSAPLAELDHFLASIRVSTPSAVGPVVTLGKGAIPPAR